MKSNPHCWKGASILTEINGIVGSLCFPEKNWQGLEARTLALTSEKILDQQ
jgi:hypothetical protein